MNIKNRLYIPVTLFCVFVITNLVFSQDYQKNFIFDGPHIFYDLDSLTIKYAIDSTEFEYRVKLEEETSFNGFHEDSAESYLIPTKLNPVPDFFPIAQRIFVLSDIHGEYDTFRKLLLGNGIIDINNFWIWGDGHLVIDGDTFDKGSGIHESLWLIYNLEQQAKSAGGQVHFILGNHEVKALRGDLKYVTEKYFKLSEIFSQSIPELYYENTFWGRWLRSKNVIIKIGPLIFVHGGIHTEIVNKNYSISDINSIMRKNLDLSLEEIKTNTTLSFLFRKDGPIRYRGFFEPDSLPSITNDQVTEILNHFNAQKIIVGHTSRSHIYGTYDNRVIGIDCGITHGENGEGLLIKDGNFYRANNEGILTLIF